MLVVFFEMKTLKEPKQGVAQAFCDRKAANFSQEHCKVGPNSECMLLSETVSLPVCLMLYKELLKEYILMRISFVELTKL